MSVEYSFGVAFGVGGEFKEPSELPGALGKMGWDELVSESEIEPGVILYIGGNRMTGPRTWAVVIKSTWLHVDGRGENYPNGTIGGITPFMEPVLEQHEALVRAMARLQISGSPRWMFLFGVG